MSADNLAPESDPNYPLTDDVIDGMLAMIPGDLSADALRAYADVTGGTEDGCQEFGTLIEAILLTGEIDSRLYRVVGEIWGEDEAPRVLAAVEEWHEGRANATEDEIHRAAHAQANYFTAESNEEAFDRALRGVRWEVEQARRCVDAVHTFRRRTTEAMRRRYLGRPRARTAWAPPAQRATRSTRQRTITRTACTTKTVSVASSSGGGGGGSGGDDPQLGDGDPPRPPRPWHGWQARHGRRDDLSRALAARVRGRWWRRARTHTGRRAFCRAYTPRPVTGGVR
jgi:hypothetical protein